jgi:hypothetical protein
MRPALVLVLPIPLSFGMTILRSHLWDIDVIINRTLFYGSLTALLALLYFGLFFTLQSLFQGLFKQNNAAAIVVSTLVIAALFQPLRHRIQRFIDRRFYRSKYDTAKTLEAFSATLRNEVDLSRCVSSCSTSCRRRCSQHMSRCGCAHANQSRISNPLGAKLLLLPPKGNEQRNVLGV